MSIKIIPGNLFDKFYLNYAFKAKYQSNWFLELSWIDNYFSELLTFASTVSSTSNFLENYICMHREIHCNSTRRINFHSRKNINRLEPFECHLAVCRAEDMRSVKAQMNLLFKLLAFDCIAEVNGKKTLQRRDERWKSIAKFSILINSINNNIACLHESLCMCTWVY